jgi:aminopeptidase N
VKRPLSSRCTVALLLAWVGIPGVARAQSAAPTEEFAPAGTLPKYAPRRQIDLQHMRLELSFDLAGHTLRGTETLTLAPINDGVRRITLHSTRLQIRQVRLGESTLTYRTGEETLEIDLDRAYRAGESLTLAIDYEGKPEEGIRFVGPYPDYPRRRQVWTQGEPRYHHHWFPTWDEPDDFTTSEMLLTVPAGFTAVSNGERIGVRTNPDGTRTFHYREDYPHATYLVSFVIGEMEERREEWDGIPILYYVPAGEGEKVARTFGRTPDMVRFFSERLGVRYPWEKYAQVATMEFGGGMENVSATTMYEGILKDETAALDGDANGIIAHELAHQWFGDLLTCRDWAHVWLNEGFATFFDWVYHEHWKGRDDYLLRLDGGAQSYLNETKRYRRPMVTHLFTASGRMFDSHTYPRGAWVLHMLRRLMGEEAFWKGMGHYTRKFQFQSVETDDFRRAMEEASGMSLGDFFEQWVYRPGHPELKVSWDWNEEAKTARLSVAQVQKTSDGTPIYRMPLKVAFDVGDKLEEYPIELTRAEADYSFRLSQRPRMVLFDSEHALLKTLDFPHPASEWAHQLAHGPDALHRRLAAEALAKLTHEEAAVAALISSLQGDASPEVRIAAAQALGPARTPAATSALKAALQASEIRVRAAAVEALATRKEDASLAPVFERLARSERSYAVRSAALRALAGMDAKRHWPVLEWALAQPSYQEVIRVTALDLMSESGDPRGLKPAMEWSATGRPIQARVAALRLLGKVGKERPETRERLLQAAAHPYRGIRGAALQALGDRGDPAAIAPLERMVARAPDKARREELQNTVDTLRRARTDREDTAKLRQELQRLRDEQAQLQRRIDTLEGKQPPPAGAKR